MRNYEVLLEWIRILALFSAIFIADIIIRGLEQTHLRPTWVFLLTGLAAIAVMHLLELILTSAFNRARWIRSLVLGDECIEGVWFDTVVGQHQYGLVTIHIRDGKISIVGEQFDCTGHVTATFEDYLVELKGRTLRGVYRAPQFRNQVQGEVQGFSTYIFSGHPGEAPKYYSGFFDDSSSEGRQCQLAGFRITDKNVLARLSDPLTRASTIRELMGVADSCTQLPQRA